MINIRAKNQVYAFVQAHELLSMSAKLLFGTLLWQHLNNKNGLCNPGVDLLIAETCLSRAGVFKSIEALKKQRLLEVVSGGGWRSNSYIFPAIHRHEPLPIYEMYRPKSGRYMADQPVQTLDDRGPKKASEGVQILDPNQERTKKRTIPILPVSGPKIEEPQGSVGLGLASPDFDKDFRAAYPRDTLDAIEPARAAYDRLTPEERANAVRCAPRYAAEIRARDRKRVSMVRWINEKRWQPYVEDELRRASGGPVAVKMIWIQEGSDELAAWTRHAGKTKLPTRESQHNSGLGLYRPTRWPPGHASPVEDVVSQDQTISNMAEIT